MVSRIQWALMLGVLAFLAGSWVTGDLSFPTWPAREEVSADSIIEWVDGIALTLSSDPIIAGILVFAVALLAPLRARLWAAGRAAPRSTLRTFLWAIIWCAIGAIALTIALGWGLDLIHLEYVEDEDKVVPEVAPEVFDLVSVRLHRVKVSYLVPTIFSVGLAGFVAGWFAHRPGSPAP